MLSFVTIVIMLQSKATYGGSTYDLECKRKVGIQL